MFIVDATRKITVNMANVISINQERNRIGCRSKVDDLFLGLRHGKNVRRDLWKNARKIFRQTLSLQRILILILTGYKDEVQCNTVEELPEKPK